MALVRRRLGPAYTAVLGVYALVVALVGLRAVGVVPDLVLLLYVPAVAAAMLVGTFLHNALGVVNPPYYPLVLLFSAPYAVVLVVIGRWVAARLRGEKTARKPD